MSLCSFSVFLTLCTLSWHAFSSRDGDDSGRTGPHDGTGAETTDIARHDVALTSHVSEAPPSDEPNPLETIQKMGDLIQKAAEQKRIRAEYDRKTAGIAKALGLLVDAKRKVNAAVSQNGKDGNISLAELMSKDFGDSLRSALEEAGAVNRSDAVMTPAKALPAQGDSSLVQFHTSAMADSSVPTPDDFSDLVTRVRTAATKVESDATTLHDMYGTRHIESLNHMLASLTQAAKFVQSTAQHLAQYPPRSAAEIGDMSQFLHEAELNMGQTSKQLFAMKHRLAEIDKHEGWLAAIDKQMGKPKPEASLLALDDTPSKRAIDAHEQMLDDSTSHQSDPKLASVLNRTIHQLTHTSKETTEHGHPHHP